MINIKIGDTERELNRISESWINQQINRRRADGHSVCVRVTIRQDQLNMTLSTPNCPGRSGGRPPTRSEKQVFDLWDQKGLNSEKFTGGNLIAFLKQFKAKIKIIN